jgi:hypothetical protein
VKSATVRLAFRTGRCASPIARDRRATGGRERTRADAAATRALAVMMSGVARLR